MSFKMNDIEEIILAEIKNGRTDYIFEKQNDDTLLEIIESPYFLGTFGYIDYELHSDEKTVGYKNIKLTDKGRHYFMTEEEIREDGSEKVKQLFFDGK